MLKKFVSVIMAAMLVFGMCANAAYFTDLQDGSYDWVKDTINTLADKGVIRGYSDGTYGPAKSVTRQEAFTLFSRVIGVNDSDNAYVVEFNQNEYKTTADKYNTYAKAELCLMLERKVLQSSEIDTYLSEENKDKVMLRYEAAVLVAKILNIRQSFDENAQYSLDFTDVDEIPQEARAAVAFAKENGIISGMDDGSFSPNSAVTRAQMAIMLERVIEKLGISYGHGTVTQVYESENAIEIDGVNYDFDSEVLFAVNGKEADISNVKVGDNITTVNTNMGLWFVDIIRESELEFETIKGKVLSATESTVKLTDGREYNVSAFAVWRENSQVKKLSEMNFENPVTIELVNGFVRSVDGTGTICEYEKAQIISITTIPAKMIKFEDEYGDIHEIKVADEAKITYNGYDVEDIEIFMPKLTMYVRIDNDVIDRICVYPVFEVESVKVNQIFISKTESDILFDETKIKIDENTKFVDENMNEQTIYDLRLDDSVKLEFSKGQLSLVTNTKYVAPTSFAGTVEEINKDEIVIQTNDEKMYIALGAKIEVIRYSDAAKLSVSSVKVGDKVLVAGEYNENDEFICTSIII